jgi:hypothetical protein
LIDLERDSALAATVFGVCADYSDSISTRKVMMRE